MGSHVRTRGAASGRQAGQRAAGLSVPVTAGGDGCRGGPAGLPLNAGRDQDVLEDGRGIGQALHVPRERYLLTLRAAQWGSEYGQHALLSEAE